MHTINHYPPECPPTRIWNKDNNYTNFVDIQEVI